jgi:hypothetical protein
MDRLVRTNNGEDHLNEPPYAIVEEVLAAYHATLPRYHRAYRELARCVGAPPLGDEQFNATEPAE